MSSDSSKPAKSETKIVISPDIAEANSNEKAVEIVTDSAAFKPTTSLVCAPVWRRGLAAVIDEIGIYALANLPAVIAIYAVVYVTRSGIRPKLFSAVEASMKNSSSGSALFFYILLSVFLALFVPTIRVLYFAVFESSRSQASPGKRLLGLKVVNAHGDRFRFWPCFGKAVMQSLLCALCVGPPVLLSIKIGLPKETGIALLVGGFATYLLLCYGVIAFNKERQTLLDKLMRRFVVRTTSPGPKQKTAPDFTHNAFWCAVVSCMIGYGGLQLLHTDRILTEYSPTMTPNLSGISVVSKRTALPGTIASSADFELRNTGRLFTPVSTVADVSKVQGALILSEIPEGSMVYQDEIVTKFATVSSVSSARELSADESYSYRMNLLKRDMAGIDSSDNSWRKAYTTRAWIHNEHGDYKAAIEDCKLAIANSKYSLGALESEVQLNLARAFAGLHSYTSAKNSLAKVDFDDSDIQQSVAYAVRASIYRHDGKLKLAAADEKKAAELRRDEEALNLSRKAVKLTYNPADDDTALELWRQALTLSSNPSIYRDRAEFYAKNPNDLQAALKDATAAIEHSRGQKIELNSGYSLRADIYDKLGDKQAAERDRSKIVEIAENEE